MQPRSTFDEDQARAHYRLLEHEPHGVTELFVRSADGHPPLIGFFDDEDAFLDAACSWSGRRSVYVGAQPRKRYLFELAPNRLAPTGRRGNNGDIAHVTLLFHDLDPETNERQQAKKRNGEYDAAATDGEHASAMAAAELVARWETFEVPVLMSSGNGAYVAVAVDLPATAAVAGQLRTLFDELQRAFGKALKGHDVRLDNTFDFARLMTLAGTIKVKCPNSRRRSHRMARFTVIPDREVDHRFCDYIKGLTPKADNPTETGHISYTLPKTLSELPDLCPAWNRVYTGVDTDGDGRRHPILYFLTAVMLKAGLSAETIHDALMLHDQYLGQKMRGRSSREYVEMLIRRAAGFYPSCGLAQRLLGSDEPCRGCDRRSSNRTEPRYRLVPKIEKKEDTGIVRRARGSFVEVEFDLQKPLPMDWARTLVRHEIERFLLDVRVGEGDEQVLLVKGLPGLGKTFITAQAVTTVASFCGGFPSRSGERLRFVLLVDRLDRMPEIEEELRRTRHGRAALEQLVQIKGKLAYTDGRASFADSLCKHAARVSLLRKANYAGSEHRLACGSCGVRQEGCPYLEQFDPKKSWVMCVPQLFSGRVEQNDPEIVIADEGLLSFMLQQRVAVTVGEIEYFKTVITAQPGEWSGLVHLAEVLARAVAAGPMTGGELRLLLSELEDLQRVCVEVQALEEVELKIEREYDANRLPKRFMGQLLRVVQEEERGAGNSRLAVEAAGNENVLVVRDVGPGRVHRPMIVLDSTGDPQLYEEVLGREVQVFDPLVPAACRVVQVAAGAYGKHSLRRSSMRRRLVEVVKQIAETRDADAVVGVVTFKEEIPVFKAELPDALFAHFWGLRGTNDLAVCTDLIVVGTPTINVEQLEQAVAALYWQGPPLDFTNVERWQRLGRLGDEDVEVRVRHYLDPRLDRWLFQGREAELLQAAARVRPLEQRDQTLWLLTNLPVPGLEPTDLFLTLDDLVREVAGIRGDCRIP